DADGAQPAGADVREHLARVDEKPIGRTEIDPALSSERRSGRALDAASLRSSGAQNLQARRGDGSLGNRWIVSPAWPHAQITIGIHACLRVGKINERNKNQRKSD